MHKIAAIIVIYYPEYDSLERLVDVLSRQVDSVIVVDNGSADGIADLIKKRLNSQGVYIDAGANLGVAGAYNVGAAQAKSQAMSRMILFDQDSQPERDMLDKLMEAMSKKIDEGARVAAVGPQYADVKALHVSPVTLSGITLHQIKCAADNIIEADHLISSGCLISMSALDKVGPFNEELFIDNVDVEWCLRAKYNGYNAFAVCGAYMRHDMGDRFADVMGYKVNVHSPLRNYYMMRNAVWLVKQSWLPLNRRLAEFFKLFKKYIVYSLLIGSSYENWKMMSKGIWHALNGTMGKYEK